MSALLNYRIYGDSEGTPLYILHGIFGMSDNWHYHSQLFAKNFKVVALDARNHGKSFHDDAMPYEAMAKDIAVVMEHLGHSKIHLMGHSMGGKTAMVFANLFPSLLASLILVDIAPKTYPAGHEMYFKAFRELPLENYKSRAEADAAFEPYAPESSVRQFLLKNLEPMKEGGYKTKFNLDALYHSYQTIIGSLDLPVQNNTFPVLVVKGSKSGYVKEDDILNFERIYNNVTFETIQNAGHWVHADNPGEFYEKILHFLLQQH